MKKTLLLFLGITFLTVAVSSAQTVGQEIVVNNVKYTVTAVGPPNTVEVSGLDVTTGVTTALVIPASISTVDGDFDVTNIVNNAFATNSEITSVTIEALAPKVPFQCFLDCTGISTATISSNTITSIEQQAFSNCSALTTIVLNPECTNIGRAGLQGSIVNSIDLSNIVTLGRQAIDGIPLVQIALGSTFTGGDARSLEKLSSCLTLEVDLETPPTTAFTFVNTTKGNIDLYLPSASAVTAFQANASWMGFKSYNVGSAPTLSTTNLEQELGFSFYPNPTKNSVSIQSKQLNNAKVGVYDLNGRVLFNQTINGTSSEINISNLASGIYLFKVQVENAAFTKRIVKQ